MSHRPNAKQPEADQAVSNANIEAALHYDKKYTKEFSEVDTDGDGKISDAEVKALLEKEHLYVRLTKALAMTNVLAAILCACLVLGFVYAIKDTSSSGGNLIDTTNGKALHTAVKEEFSHVAIDEKSLSGLAVVPVGSSSAAATRTQVGTIAKSDFLNHLNNAKSNSAQGVAQFKRSDGITISLVKYVAKQIKKTENGNDVELEVELDDHKFQFGVQCQSSGTQCPIFAFTVPAEDKETGRNLRERQRQGLGHLQEKDANHFLGRSLEHLNEKYTELNTGIRVPPPSPQIKDDDDDWLRDEKYNIPQPKNNDDQMTNSLKNKNPSTCITSWQTGKCPTPYPTTSPTPAPSDAREHPDVVAVLGPYVRPSSAPTSAPSYYWEHPYFRRT